MRQLPDTYNVTEIACMDYRDNRIFVDKSEYDRLAAEVERLRGDNEILTASLSVRSEHLKQRESALESRDAKVSTLQARIDELEAELSRINRIASCGSVDSWMSLSDDDKRKWFAVTLDVDHKKADRIKDLEAEVERQRKVIELAKSVAQKNLEFFRNAKLEGLEASAEEDMAAIADLEKGVG